MIRDRQLDVSTAQAVTAIGTTVSTDKIDLAVSLRDIGRSNELRWSALVGAGFTSGGAGTLVAQLVESDNADLSAGVVLASSNGGTPLALAALTAGAVLLDIPMPTTRRRYLGMNYVVATAVMTGGTINAGMAKNTQTPIADRPTGVTGY